MSQQASFGQLALIHCGKFLPLEVLQSADGFATLCPAQPALPFFPVSRTTLLFRLDAPASYSHQLLLRAFGQKPRLENAFP